MKTVRVVVTRSHRHSVDRIVEVGEFLDLPEYVATERITTNAVRLVTPEPAPAAPVLAAERPVASVAGSEGSGKAAGEASASPAAAATPADGPAASLAPATEPPTPEPKPAPPAPAKPGRRNAN